MLFSLFPKLGFLAILVQAIPFTLAHLGKPVMEVYGSLPAGIFLGILAYRGRSVIGCGLLHFLVASSLDFLLFFGWSQPHL
jgi:membrane protease YdiL (CAAX protease family)